MPSASRRKDYYKVLNVSDNATVDEIRVAYKKLALTWHPDRHHNAVDKERAKAKFIEINRAYRALTERAKPPVEPIPSGSSPPDIAPPASPKYSTSTPSSAFPIHPDFHDASSSDPSSETDCQTTPPSSPQDETLLPCTPGASFPNSASRTPKTESWIPPWSPVLSIKSLFPSRFRARPFTSRENSTAKSRGNSAPKRQPTSPSHKESQRRTPRTHHLNPIQKQSKRGLSHNHEYNESNKTPRKRAHAKERYNTKTTHDSELRRFTSSRNTNREWRYHLQLTLEELFHGTDYKFRINRYHHSNVKKDVTISVPIPPGCKDGTEIRCVAAGNSCRDGTLQDVIFVIEEIPHHTFTREGDDLIMEVKVPWVDSLQKETGEISFDGIDGEELWVSIPYRLDRELEGEQFIMGAGMPMRCDGRVVRRGDLIVRWKIDFDTVWTSRWRTLKNMLRR